MALEDFTKEFEAVKKTWEDFTNKVNSFSMDAVVEKFKNFTAQMKQSFTDLSVAIKQNDRMTKSYRDMASGLGQLLTLTTNFDAFKNLSVQGGYASSTMVDQFDLLIQRFGSFEKAAENLAGKVGKPFQVALKAGEAATRAYLSHVSSSEQLESTYLSLQAAAGQLGKEFSDLTHLDDRLAKFNVMLQDAASQSNKTLKEVAQYTTALGAIPGVLNQTIDTGRGFDEHLTGLIGTLRLAAGAHRSVEEVTSAMTVAYEKLSNPQGEVTDNAQKGARLFALMSEASNALNLRFEDTQGYLKHVADTFKNIGDNTEGATNILSRFSSALQHTGLTARASVDVVQNMVDSVKSLEMGTKALISMRAGGPGGLQGAFRVENLLRQGKIDEVVKMMEQSLKQQFGGRIYTQEEAAQSPFAASQFMRQRTLLQSGAFGKLARDDETATRLLEALKAGPSAAGPVIDAMKAVGDVTEKGNNMQERQFTALNRLNGSMDRLVSINEARFKIDARKAIGTSDESEFAEELRNYRDLITQQSVTDMKRKDPLSMEQYEGEQSHQGVRDYINTYKVLSSVANMAKGKLESGARFVSEFASEAKNSYDQQKEKRAIMDRIDATNKVVADNNSMKNMTNRVMNQPIPNLATQMPKATETTRHEVNLSPLEVNIKVESSEGLKVQTTTNRTPNARVNISSAALRGGVNETITK